MKSIILMSPVGLVTDRSHLKTPLGRSLNRGKETTNRSN